MKGFRSLTAKYIFVSAIILAFFLLYTIAGYIFTLYMEGDAKKINLAGRERMLTYKISSHMHFISSNAPSADRDVQSKGAETAMDEYEEVLHGLRDGNETLGLEPLHKHDHKSLAQLNVLIELWDNTQKPLLRKIIRDRLVGKETCNDCHAAVRANIGKIETLVKYIEEHHDVELRNFNLFRLAAFWAAVVISVFMFLFVRASLVMPVKRLKHGASEIETGNFDVRVDVRNRDEIGDLGCTFNNMAQNLRNFFNEKEEHLHELNVLNEIAITASHTLALEVMLEKVMVAMLSLDYLKLLKKGAIFLYDEDKDALKIVVSHNFSDEQKELCATVQSGECICGHSLREGKILLSDSNAKDARHTKTYSDAIEHGHIILPLKSRDKMLGVLCLYLPAGIVLPEKALKLYEAIADIISVAVHNALNHKQLAMLAQSLDSSMDLIVITDLDGMILHVNPRAEEYIGHAQDELRGKHISVIQARRNIAAMWEEIFRKTIADGAWKGEITHARKDGHEYPVLLSTSLVKYEGNKVIAFIGIARDITERKLAEEEKKILQSQLLQSQKLESIGMLAGGVAHDFNNMLSTILGYSELSLMELPDNHPLTNKIRMIRKAGEKAAELTRQLLAFSRKQALELKVVRLNAVIENMMPMLARMIGEDVILEFKPGSVNQILADPVQMEQILMNLAVNARDAMPRGGRLIIETSDTELDEEYACTHEGVTPGPHVMLCVTDTGEGMSREVLDRIFEPFFTTKAAGKGTGLGLATVYGIVKQHNGHIWVYSEKGSGTTFKIYLPVSGGEAQKADRKTVEIIPSGTETILVVDDEELVRQLIMDTLQPLGYTLLEASGGEKALDISAKFEGTIHLLLTDVIMPVINGRDLSRTLKAERPDIKTIFMSGYTDDVITRLGALETGTAFLQKPVTPGKLARKVREILDENG